MKISCCENSPVSVRSMQGLVDILPDFLLSGLDEIAFIPADDLGRRLKMIGTDDAGFRMVELPSRLVIAVPSDQREGMGRMDFIRGFWPDLAQHLSLRGNREPEDVLLVLTTHPAQDDVQSWRDALMRRLYSRGLGNEEAGAYLYGLAESLEMDEQEMASLGHGLGEWRREQVRDEAQAHVRDFLGSTGWDPYAKAKFTHAMYEGTDESHQGLPAEYLNELSALLKRGDPHRAGLLHHLKIRI